MLKMQLSKSEKEEEAEKRAISGAGKYRGMSENTGNNRQILRSVIRHVVIFCRKIKSMAFKGETNVRCCVSIYERKIKK